MFRTSPKTGRWMIGCLALAGVLLLQTGFAQEKPTTRPAAGEPGSAIGVIDRDGKGTRTFAPDKAVVRQKAGANQEKDPKKDPKKGKITRITPPIPGKMPTAAGPGGTPVPGDPAAMPGAVPPSPDGIDRTPTGDAIEQNPTGVNSVPCKRLPLDSLVSLDFKEVPIDDLIRLISCWTGKNFLLTQSFAGKNVTLMSPQPVTVAQAYRAFLSSLRSHGLTTVPAGAFLKIVPDTQAKQEPIRLLKKNSGVPDQDEMVTKLIELQHVPASEITQVLDQFKSKTGEIVAYGEDLLIVTDTGTMIRRLMKLLKELDIPTDKEKIWVRQVEYAEASEVVNIITGIFPQAGEGAKKPPSRAAKKRPTRGRKSSAPAAAVAKIIGGEAEPIAVSKVIADERTNQIIVVCNRTTYMRLDKLLRKVDVPIPGEGQIHIIYLENADSEEISSTLSSLTSGSASKTGGRTTSKKKGSSSKSSKGGGGAALFEGEVKITADKGTNALVVEASLKDFRSLKKVIEKLDIRRKQVYVEAIIMEISSNKDRKFGMSGSAGTTFNVQGEEVPMLFGLGGLGISGFDVQQLTSGGAAMGLQGPLVDVSTGSTGEAGVGDLSIPTFGFILQAIQSNSDVNILSTPHILTLDNEEAEIQVGKQIPYRASSMGGLGGLGGLASMAGLSGLGGSSGMSSMMGGMGGYGGLSSMMGGMGGMVQRIDVDLTLKITPHVNESNFVKLEIDQSIEDVESIDRELGPTTSKRKVKNVVVVRGGEPVVIGGLIRDTESDGVDKIPLLGDIPLIGILFRQTIRTVEKKNLLMIIVPHIIDDPSDLGRIHRERMEEMRRFAEYLATKQKEYKGMVDYNKKSGGLETMRQVVDRARADREERERARFEGTAIDVIGPPETHDLDYDPESKRAGDGQKQKDNK